MSPHRDDEPSPVFDRHGGSRPVGGRGPRDWSVDEGALDEADDFTPPNPKNPLAGARPGVVLGALMALGGIVGVLIAAWVPGAAPSWLAPALIAVAVLGLVVLFLQMPRSRGGGSGDGAQV